MVVSSTNNAQSSGVGEGGTTISASNDRLLLVIDVDSVALDCLYDVVAEVAFSGEAVLVSCCRMG